MRKASGTRPPAFHPAVILATWFWSGWLRPAPGTWGSLAAMPFVWWILEFHDAMRLGKAALLCFVIGCWASAVYGRLSRSHDSGEIVIDEVAGIWFTFAFIGYYTTVSVPVLVLGFLAFRLFDIVKPFPIRLADRRVPGGYGVMLDDLLAAIYAAAAVLGVIYLANNMGVTL